MTVWALVKNAPPIRQWRVRRWRRRFLSAAGYSSFFGLFPDFAAARRALPASPEYDSAPVVDGLAERVSVIYPYDYPVIHWLGRAFADGARRVYDIGGSVGLHFLSYRRVLPYPQGIEWRVSEVPAAVRAGRVLATRLGESALSFTDSLDTSALHADIWLSAGAIQYIEDIDLGRLLDAAPQRPRHIILNKLPLFRGEGFVTAQNIGDGAFSPAHVFGREPFIAGIEARGYALVDAWEVLERGLYLPGHPEKSFSKFSGLYFRATGPSDRASAASPGGALEPTAER